MCRPFSIAQYGTILHGQKQDTNWTPDDAKGVIPYNQGKNPDYQNVVDFCKLFNIELKKIRDRRIPKNLKKHEGVLITPWNFNGTGSHHCLRFCGHVSEKKFVVLDPSPLDGQQFPVWGKGIHKGLVL